MIRRQSIRDDGATLVEVVIAVVLMGTIVAATLTTMRTSVLGGELHRDHSNAHAWLQSASDVLYAAPKTYCDPNQADKGEAAVRAAYDSVIDAVPNPLDWRDWQIQIIGKVQFWNAANIDADPDVEYFFGSNCDPSLTLQLIKIEVKSTTGEIIEDVEIVK